MIALVACLTSPYGSVALLCLAPQKPLEHSPFSVGLVEFWREQARWSFGKESRWPQSTGRNMGDRRAPRKFA